ncbi:MAG TPA: cytochrome c3 family protein [Burkholderiaceae bacterium]|nr:cytochrome c3 family protein [Burkholderiaceae bacterium]
MKRTTSALVSIAALLLAGVARADGDLPSKFTNRDTIGNTRHNLTQRQVSGGGPAGATMDSYRNDYEEVCVYCHTPHGANRTVTAPLWNRTMKVTTYQTYDLLNTGGITQPVTQPGIASLTCLSCHDGTTAVDSIINMPGAGRYNAAQETVENTSFLNSEWNNRRGPDATVHARLSNTECLACHAAGAGIVGAGATDFSVFAIGTDLRNDHPVGIRYPAAAGAGTDFKDPPRKEARLAYFDANGNARADPNEIRLYNSGDGYEVECASCHDPHGVPSAGQGSAFNPTFLRISNAGSAVCLSCHTK